jgi:hypothetical protein
MSYYNPSFKVSQKSLIIFGWFCISVLFVLLDFKRFLSFNSVDEELFLNISQADSSVHFIRYVIWGYYISFLTNVSLLFPIIFNLFIFSYTLNVFVKKFELQKIYLVLLLCIPSLFLFSQTILRDFFLLTLNMILFLKINQKTNFKSISIIVFLISIIFILRPLFGLILFFSCASSFLIKRVKFSLSYVLLGQIVIVFVLLSFPSIKEMFFTEYNTLNVDDVFSLLRIDTFNVDDFQLAIGVFFNWLLYYFGINLSMNNSLLLFPFILESIIYLIFFSSFIFFNKMKYKENYLYRFSFWIIIYSILSSVVEADWASVYRHKLFFLPALLYLVSLNNFKKSTK